MLSQGLSRVFSHTIVWRHQFFNTQPFFSSSHICTWLLEKTYVWLYSPLSAKKCFFFLIYCLGWSQLFFQGVVKSLSCVWLLVTPWTVAYQAPPSMEFSRQEYWSGLPFPSPEDLPDPGIKPMSPTWAEGFFTTKPPWKPSKEQAYFNFMAAVTVSSDFGVQENCLSLFPFFPIYLLWRDGTGCHDLYFWLLSFKSSFSLSSFTFSRGSLIPRKTRIYQWNSNWDPENERKRGTGSHSDHCKMNN